MRKRVFGRQFKRDTNERKALFKGLMSSLVLNERITTTIEKAKAIRPKLEKLVTKAKKGNGASYRIIVPYLTASAIKKFMGEVAPRFINRPGGYTRIIRVGNRIKDNAQMAIMEWTEKPAAIEHTVKKTVRTTKNSGKQPVLTRGRRSQDGAKTVVARKPIIRKAK
ncbi:MAG: 50S ribosomal protein L17 [Candidatus Levybacteria bacterium]|nr:50S ribosomal protein L17 [Candidatus Levybacteria bacterium]